MSGKWANVDAGPRQVKDANRAISALRGEGQAQDEIYGVIGGKESRSTVIAMMGVVRDEVTALEKAIGERYGWKVTRANVRQVIADYEAALVEARKSRPVVDNRRTPEEEAERAAAAAARDAEYRAAQDAQNAVMAQVMAKAPAGAKALIYAEYHVDESDPMTDYFNSRVTRTVAIGFRTGSREDFRQLRAAAARFPETAHMASDETLKAWSEAGGFRVRDDLEHRDNYSMGGGNYLSDHGWSGRGTGWVVRSRDFPCGYVHLTEDAAPGQAVPERAATTARASVPRSAAVPGDALEVIGRAEISGNTLRLTERVDRATYVAVAEALAAIGGRWNRKAQAFLFASDAAPLVASLLEDGTVTRPQDEGWFPTPAPVVAEILAAADLVPGMEVLEPSAGEGAIATAAVAAGCAVDCVELNAKRAGTLLGIARTVSAADFLTVPQRPVYDRVLMNPPFADKADIAHVTHALGFVKPGGLLIAVMSAGTAFREDRATADFREQVTASGGEITPLPEGAFKESGTDMRTVLVTLPAAGERTQAA